MGTEVSNLPLSNSSDRSARQRRMASLRQCALPQSPRSAPSITPHMRSAATEMPWRTSQNCSLHYLHSAKLIYLYDQIHISLAELRQVTVFTEDNEPRQHTVLP